jgi:hypothetical protein
MRCSLSARKERRPPQLSATLSRSGPLDEPDSDDQVADSIAESPQKLQISSHCDVVGFFKSHG